MGFALRKYENGGKVMTVYRAENIGTGEVIEGCAKDLAKKIGVAQKYILNASSNGRRVKRTWYITKDSVANKTHYSVPMSLQEEWDAVTAPYKAVIARKRGIKKGNGRIRLRTMYNVGVY
jgi:hypothetical protein